MFLNVSELWFFKRTKDVLAHVCNGSPSSCKNYNKFYDAFKIKRRKDDDDSRQSYVGFLQYKKNPNILIMYKISRDEDNVVMHEYEILRQLDRAARLCPHFVRVYGLANYAGGIVIEPPKTLCEAEGVERKILLLEYIHHLSNLENFICADSSESARFSSILSLIAQVLIAIRITRALQITHNDLHCQNILVRECDERIVFKYILRDKELILPSFGNTAVIIDYGMGRAPAAPQTPLLGSFQFTQYGYYMDTFSPAVDYVRFLSAIRTVCSTKHKQIARWCSQFLKPLKGIDVENGWDNFTSKSAVDLFDAKISRAFKDITLLDDTVWIENLQLLINRPLQPMEARDIGVFEPFFNNWRKFEARIASEHELNYLFKCLCEAIKLWRSNYLSREALVVERIKYDFLQRYEKVIKFHCPADINYEDMICSLLMGAQFLEGFYYDHLVMLRNKRPTRKGALSRPNCDDDIWGSFMDTFGGHLDVDRPKSANFVWRNFHLETIV